MPSDFPAIDAWTEWFEKYREELSEAAIEHVGALRHAFVSGWLDGRNRLLVQLEGLGWDGIGKPPKGGAS